MSIAIGESRRDVCTRPYFRGRAVCPRADTTRSEVCFLLRPEKSARGGSVIVGATGGDDLARPWARGIEAIVFRTIGDQAVAGGVGPSAGGPAAPAAKAASATRNGDTTGIAAAWTARPSPGFAGEFWGLAPTTRARTWTGPGVLADNLVKIGLETALSKIH